MKPSDISRLQKVKMPLHGVAEPSRHMGIRLQECNTKQSQVLIFAVPGVNFWGMLI